MQGLLHNMDWVEGLRSVYLTPAFHALSGLGSAAFLLLFLVFGFLAIDKRLFARAIAIVLVSAIINDWLKHYFIDPRPPQALWLDANVGSSFGFPSGHTQVAVALWLWIAFHVRRRWAAVMLVALTIGVAASRLYLGVHDIEDVLGGAAIGFAILGLAIVWSGDRLTDVRDRYPMLPVVVGALLTVVTVATWPGPELRVPLVLGGLLCAFWIGYRLEVRRWHFQQASAVRSGIAGALGVIGLLAVIGALAQLRSAPPLTVLPAVFFVGLYISLIAPRLMVRFGLLRYEEKVAGPAPNSQLSQ
jgi:membrane-associated phospholipid phosphatase